jgi:hypothetical protein
MSKVLSSTSTTSGAVGSPSSATSAAGCRTRCEEERVHWPPLGHEPLDEEFGDLKPITPFED